MRTRIWSELTKVKHDIEYLRVYLIFQSGINRFINVSILIFSSAGILGWGVFQKPKYAGIACAITAGISLIKLVSPYFILSDKETKKLDKYYATLVQHYDMVEKFWYDSEDGKIEQTSFTNEFYSLTKAANELNDRYSDLPIMHIWFLIRKAKINSDSYFLQTFNVKS